jgi:hypothetical protein
MHILMFCILLANGMTIDIPKSYEQQITYFPSPSLLTVRKLPSQIFNTKANSSDYRLRPIFCSTKLLSKEVSSVLILLHFCKINFNLNTDTSYVKFNHCSLYVMHCHHLYLSIYKRKNSIHNV